MWCYELFEDESVFGLRFLWPKQSNDIAFPTLDVLSLFFMRRLLFKLDFKLECTKSQAFRNSTKCLLHFTAHKTDLHNKLEANYDFYWHLQTIIKTTRNNSVSFEHWFLCLWDKGHSCFSFFETNRNCANLLCNQFTTAYMRIQKPW